MFARIALALAMVLTVLAMLAQQTAAQTPSVDEIVKKANHAAYYQGKDGRARVKMVIADRQGRTRERQFTILRYDVPGDDGDQKMYVYFHRPADVNKMVFMVHKHVGGDDDRWLYLPALDLVKRISSKEKRNSFVGSHFYYEDVSGRNINDDRHELVKTTKNYYVLKNTPKDLNSVEFAYYTMWIMKSNFLVRKIDYYDAKGEKYRSYDVQKVETIQGHATITTSVMSDLRSGGKTTLTYSAVKYDVGLPDAIFAERYLRRAPRQYLK